MGGKRQNIQYSLALDRTGRGESPLGGHQGTEPPVAKPDPESPALAEGATPLLRLNPDEPPWYGPVCPVVWEGRHREMPPYPDQFTIWLILPEPGCRSVCSIRLIVAKGL